MHKSTLFLVIALICYNCVAEEQGVAKPGCPNTCGNLTVAYPFGIGVNSGCSLNPSFDIVCDTSTYPSRAFIGNYNKFEVVGIDGTKIRVKNEPAIECPNREINVNSSDGYCVSPIQRLNLSGTPFSFSDTNKLMGVGCQSFSSLSLDFDDGGYSDDIGNIGGCMASCNKTEDLKNSSCSGIGCCQTSIRKGHQRVIVGVRFQGRTRSFNPCAYSFLAEENSYSFSITDISSDEKLIQRKVEQAPLVIDWEIGQTNCSVAGTICQGNSFCVDSDTGIGGYHCTCSTGFKGNPYLSPGCKDIDECESNPCHEKATCTNFPGSHNCSCNLGYTGDGIKECIMKPHSAKKTLKPTYTVLIVLIGTFLVFLLTFGIYKLHMKRKEKKQKEFFYKQNGGLVLERQISVDDHVLDYMRHFTTKELERATDNFSESRILGQGGQGTVYKGMLSDGRNVAVKKSTKVDKNQIGDFINEIVILSQVNHRSVVKLFGCCLETEVPLLVYELVPNGTLCDLIHGDAPFPWDCRLRIIAEIANGLAHLHNWVGAPILHRDIKSKNILVDEKCRAKISDFGISRHLGPEETHLITGVQGTFGYMDPEYACTNIFTDKSDVYSFGVVLVELLTGQKIIIPCEGESLVNRFKKTMKEEKLRTILDPHISEHVADLENQIIVAKLAEECLCERRNKRLSITKVVEKLGEIRTNEVSPVDSDVQDKILNIHDLINSFQLPDQSFIVEEGGHEDTNPNLLDTC